MIELATLFTGLIAICCLIGCSISLAISHRKLSKSVSSLEHLIDFYGIVSRQTACRVSEIERHLRAIQSGGPIEPIQQNEDVTYL